MSLDSNAGVVQCLGELYHHFGRRILSGFLETVNIVSKLLKFSEVLRFISRCVLTQSLICDMIYQVIPWRVMMDAKARDEYDLI